MDPREFCRIRDHDFALCFTYSFDPLFFERVVERDLWAGGTRSIVVLADARQVEDAIARLSGRLRHLGRRYHLAPIVVEGAFHPKMMLRVGESGALCWVGSNNITSAGWLGMRGGNRELATCFRIDGEAPEGRAFTRRLLDTARHFVPSSYTQEAIDAVVTRDWLSGATAGSLSRSGVLITARGDVLAAQLAERWRGRRFKELRVITGSTDTRGAMLQWAIETFGVEEIHVALDPSRASFDSKRLSKLDAKVRLHPLTGQPTHAKFYWLEGPDGAAAVVGSANCSAAAWLAPLGHGGNIELVVVYDEAQRRQFSDVLGLFSKRGKQPKHVQCTGGRGSDGDEALPPGVRIVELAIDAWFEKLTVRVDRELPAASTVQIVFDNVRLALRRNRSDSTLWIGDGGPLAELGGTKVGRLLVSDGKTEMWSPPRWLDELHHLAETARLRSIPGTLGNFDRARDLGEQRRQLNELAAIGVAILHETAQFPDPRVVALKPDEPDDTDEERKAPALDLDQLVRSLSEVKSPDRPDGPTSYSIGIPIAGVMRAFFPAHDDDAPDDPIDDVDDDPDAKVGGQEDGDKKDGKGPVREQPPQELRDRLRRQMERYLRSFAEEHFAETCTATQLMQAAAYPLAVAAIGRDRGWVDSSDAAAWTYRVGDLLFDHASGSRSTGKGLLSRVAKLYEDRGEDATFRRVVGDGTFWLALTTALAEVEWDVGGERLKRALLIVEAFASPYLTATAEPTRLRMLLSRLRHFDARHAVLREAPRLRSGLAKLEEVLGANFDQLLVAQEVEQHEVGDPIWRQGIGFGFVEETAQILPNALFLVRIPGKAQPLTYTVDFFVNVHIAARKSKVVEQALASLGVEPPPKRSWVKILADIHGYPRRELPRRLSD